MLMLSFFLFPFFFFDASLERYIKRLKCLCYHFQQTFVFLYRNIFNMVLTPQPSLKAISFSSWLHTVQKYDIYNATQKLHNKLDWQRDIFKCSDLSPALDCQRGNSFGFFVHETYKKKYILSWGCIQFHRLLAY